MTSDVLRRAWLLAIGAQLAASPIAAQSADSVRRARDSTSKISHDPLFTARDAWYAAGFVVGTIALFPLDKQIAKEIRRPDNLSNRFLRNVANDFQLSASPGSLIIGGTLYTVGRVGHFDRVADLGLHGTEAIVFAEVVNGLVKGIGGRARPYVVNDTNPHDFAFGRGFRKGTDYSSFPSGHTVAGFAAAAAVTSETSRWWPHSTWLVAPVMFGGATAIGLARLYNDKHWASDIIMGAGIGTFSGLKIVRYNHSHPHNHLDRMLLSASVLPTADGGLAVAFTTTP
ncbi:MAG: phosphatase PAP2 family protein [Gemmatimonadota bacterium]|nr:phosphatase PAP2 family protein [Gemmatimonadota bacterium]